MHHVLCMLLDWMDRIVITFKKKKKKTMINFTFLPMRDKSILCLIQFEVDSLFTSILLIFN